MALDWHWVAPPRSARTAALDERFLTQGEAETWLGETYPDLLEAGIRAVSLYEADRLVYGPMGLEADVD